MGLRRGKGLWSLRRGHNSIVDATKRQIAMLNTSKSLLVRLLLYTRLQRGLLAPASLEMHQRGSEEPPASLETSVYVSRVGSELSPYGRL